jgi:type I restriction enzyme S subunit
MKTLATPACRSDPAGRDEESLRLSAEWTRRVLGKVMCQPRPKVRPQDFPHLQYIGMEHVEAHTTRLISSVPATEMKSATGHFWPGDVLYGRLRPYLNKVWCADREGLCSSEFIVLPKNESVDSRFLLYRLNSVDFVSFASHLNTGDRPRVDFDQISEFEVWLPPLPEQQRIVAEIEKQLTRLDAGAGALKRVQANLKRYRASVLKAACEGRLVPTEAERARAEGRSYEPADVLLQRILKQRREKWTGKGKYREPAAPDTAGLAHLPRGWSWATVEQLGATGEQPVLTGPFGTDLGREDFGETGVPVLTIGCLTDGGIKLDKAMFITEEKATKLGRYRLKAGDLLFSRMASVGRAGIVAPRLTGALINYHIMRLRLKDDVLLPKFFIAYVRGSEQVVNYKRQVNHGETREGINTEQLLSLPVALPPLAEQHRIVAEVERRLSVADELDALATTNLKRAQSLRQSILNSAFNGRILSQT